MPNKRFIETEASNIVALSPFLTSYESGGLAFEVLISSISSKVAHAFAEGIDQVIDESLQKIIDLLHIDRAVLWQLEGPGSKRLLLTHMKIRPGFGPQSKPLLTTDSFPWMVGELLSGRETRYSRIDDLPEAAAVDKATLRQYGGKYSAMAVPLFDGETPFGILALGIAAEMAWPEELAPRLRVVSHIFAGALIRRKTEEQLRQTLKELQDLKAKLEQENVYLRQEISEARSCASKIIYKSDAMDRVLNKVEQVAGVNATVLISGETGTGKEMIASAIHETSPRAGRTMVRVNCGAIPVALVESEMFGREKGAYTGALSRQIGRFELADGSTIFLDELTELPMEVQVKLLRVLQEKEVERLGSPKPIRIDVRVIAATNQNLEKAVGGRKIPAGSLLQAQCISN